MTTYPDVTSIGHSGSETDSLSTPLDTWFFPAQYPYTPAQTAAAQAAYVAAGGDVADFVVLLAQVKLRRVIELLAGQAAALAFGGGGGVVINGPARLVSIGLEAQPATVTVTQYDAANISPITAAEQRLQARYSSSLRLQRGRPTADEAMRLARLLETI